MILPDPDDLDRTLKLEVDDGTADSFDEAERIKYVLQIDVGGGVADSPTRQAMLLTAVNAGSRAFRGGVRVRLYDDARMQAQWAAGSRMSKAVKKFGGRVVSSLSPFYPTLVIGNRAAVPAGSIVLHATWQGWSGGVVDRCEERLAESEEFPLSGVLSAAIGVSEAFQHARGNVLAGQRAAGLSLWQPGSASVWRSEASSGPRCEYLPDRLWLIGLGHLGQAYAWALGLLPYADPRAVKVTLQDTDTIVQANTSTGMLTKLTNTADQGRRKTRVVANRLEALGFETNIVERLFTPDTRRGNDDPSIALVGVDRVNPRRYVGEARFDLVVDAGLGATSQSYLDMHVRAFPSGIAPSDAWPVGSDPAPPSSVLARPAYRHVAQRLTQAAEGETDAQADVACGVVQLAGVAVGAAFVGCAAAALVLSEVLRMLHDGPRYQVVDLSLRRLDLLHAVPNPAPSNGNPGFVRASSLRGD